MMRSNSALPPARQDQTGPDRHRKARGVHRVLLPAILAISLSGVSAAQNKQPVAAPDVHSRSVELFGEVLGTVRDNYVSPVKEDELTATALKAMLASLDGHSAYMTAREFADFDQAMLGSFGGVGLVLEVAGGTVRVISPVDGSPAARAGVRAGWEVTGVDGIATRSKSLTEVVRMLRGDPGTDVRVVLRDKAGHAVELTLKRDMIRLDSIYRRRIGNVGYIHITSFTRQTDPELGEALTALRHQGPLQGLIIDLRNNPGGFVDSATAVASRFLKPGSVVVRTGRTAETAVPVLAANQPEPDISLPMVVLINGGSASAAEIVASALRDNGRARLLGLTSFGKGIVQNVIPLDHGARGAVSVTTLRYYTPSGRSIQQVGIVPDLAVARTAAEARAAVESAGPSEASLTQAIGNDKGLRRNPLLAVEGPRDVPGKHHDTPLFVRPLPTDTDITADYQIQRALDLVAPGARQAKPAGHLYRKAERRRSHRKTTRR